MAAGIHDQLRLEMSSMSTTTRASLLAIHQRQSDCSLAAQTSKIIQILGGVDQIVTDYLSINGPRRRDKVHLLSARAMPEQIDNKWLFRSEGHLL